KSTGLYFESSILKENNCVIDMWKTGHSHMKRRVKEIGALCGFEKSGHFFINEPLGLGFDDGLKSACLMLQYLSNGITKKLSDKKLEIKKTFQSPTMAPFCEDGEKYQVVDSIIKKITEIKEKGVTVGSQNIEKIITINGIRFELSNGSWGLVRASSNKPSLVIVIESYESNNEVELIFNYINELLDQTGKVGEYDQKLTG
ncbi:phosphomannomutase/phosphoglucomutase, partial [Pelagibacteraceae bacterium]|nr:phosphomannomutase/phosphoglucomutase [Pelagibacteraceae bacterium]